MLRPYLYPAPHPEPVHTCRTLFPEPFEPVRQPRPSGLLVRELSDEQSERLGVARDPQRASVHRFEPHVANQLRSNLLALRVVAAVHQAGSPGSATRREDVEQHLARHRPKSADDPRLGDLPGKLLRARRRVRNDEAAIVGLHGERAGDDDLARHLACLVEHVIDPRPVHGEQDSIRILRGLRRRADPCPPPGFSHELLQLLLAARVAEHHLMAGARPDRAELATHQSGAQDANAHKRHVIRSTCSGIAPTYLAIRRFGKLTREPHDSRRDSRRPRGPTRFPLSYRPCYRATHETDLAYGGSDRLRARRGRRGGPAERSRVHDIEHTGGSPVSPGPWARTGVLRAVLPLARRPPGCGSSFRRLEG